MTSSGAAIFPLGLLLKKAQHAYRTRIDTDLRPLGLSAPQYAVLVAVAAEPGVSNAELARAAFIAPQSMQTMLVALERANLLTRRLRPDNGRVLATELTDKGRKCLEAATVLVRGVEDRLTAVDRASQGELEKSLTRVFQQLTTDRQ